MSRRAEAALTWLATRRGWQSALLLFVAGTLTALAFAPFHFWPLLFFTFPLLLHYLEIATPRQAMRHAFFFGYGFFMAGTYWIAFSLLVDASKFGWMLPFSVLGLSAAFAFYLVPMGYIFAKLRRQDSLTNLLLLVILWVATEYLRSLGMFGFPWNLMGYSVTPSARLMQSAALVGTFGLSIFVMIAALMPILWWRGHPARQVATSALLAFITIAYLYGMWRMPSDPAPLSDTRLRIVQANIPQSLKWTPEGKDQSMRLHGVLTYLQTDAPPANLVIWPETAFPFVLSDKSEWLPRLRNFAPDDGYLITGAVRGWDVDGTFAAANSLFVINPKGEVTALYDKHQLVPFGEFVPLRNILPLQKIVPSDLDFSRGDGVHTLSVAGAPPFSPLICYEVIFPWLVVDKSARPAWLLNLTNDAWFGVSPGPYQHFAMARMRAVEQGLPLVRAANTGISAVVDPFGQVLRFLPLAGRGVIDSALPEPLAPTFYANWGERPAILLLMLCTVFWWWRKRILA
jgi:apolipoprotein N-acyltransferase